MSRLNGRKANELRPLEFELNYTKWAEGSVLVKSGDTHVVCTASVDERVPRWLHQSKEAHGWLTAEYGMLPRSTSIRVSREKQWPRGRTQEISRLIGRSLRMAIDLEKLGQRQILVDCDVIQADGGTRTAAVTGSWLAVNLALKSLVAKGVLSRSPIRHQVAAVSVGVVNGEPLLDLDYKEDSSAESDMNVVMSDGQQLIEVQSTGEKRPFSREELDKLLDLAELGIKEILALQAFALMQG